MKSAEMNKAATRNIVIPNPMTEEGDYAKVRLSIKIFEKCFDNTSLLMTMGSSLNMDAAMKETGLRPYSVLILGSVTRQPIFRLLDLGA